MPRPPPLSCCRWVRQLEFEAEETGKNDEVNHRVGKRASESASRVEAAQGAFEKARAPTATAAAGSPATSASRTAHAYTPGPPRRSQEAKSTLAKLAAEQAKLHKLVNEHTALVAGTAALSK